MTARTGKYPGAGGITTLGTYIPEIWSGQMIEKFYKATVFAAISRAITGASHVTMLRRNKLKSTTLNNGQLMLPSR